jgi:hypothetical protein
MLCIFEHQESVASLPQVIAQWRPDLPEAGGGAVQYLCTGAVIAQKGL